MSTETHDGVNRDELMEVVLVFNGPLGMSAGKMGGQAFQAAARMMNHAAVSYQPKIGLWIEQGTRTIAKAAKTPAMFERVCAEVEGFTMRDEGFTEVEADAPTLFVAYPRLHRDRPALLDNKKVGLA